MEEVELKENVLWKFDKVRQSVVAVKRDYQAEPMPRKWEEFTFERVFTDSEMVNLRRGNVPKAIAITTTLTLFIATFVQANKWIFAFTFIFGNLVLLPSALFLYKANGISLKKETFERETLGGDILFGGILAIVASLLSLLWLPIYKGRTELAFAEDGKMGVGVTILYVISLVFVSGICKEIFYRGFAKRFCGAIFGEMTAIKNIIRENDSFKDVWIDLLENALRYKIYRENGFLTENATERYSHFKKLFPELSERVPQRHIATYFGIAPESLSRIRSAMKERRNR